MIIGARALSTLEEEVPNIEAGATIALRALFNLIDNAVLQQRRNLFLMALVP
jgi:hypothetical protein